VIRATTEQIERWSEELQDEREPGLGLFLQLLLEDDGSYVALVASEGVYSVSAAQATTLAAHGAPIYSAKTVRLRQLSTQLHALTTFMLEGVAGPSVMYEDLERLAYDTVNELAAMAGAVRKRPVSEAMHQGLAIVVAYTQKVERILEQWSQPLEN